MASSAACEGSIDPVNNFIGGVFSPPESGQYMDSFEPATGAVLFKLAESNDKDVDRAVESALEAFPLWSGLSTEARSDHLFRVADLIQERLEEFALAESRDNGKPVSLARAMDIPRAVHNFRFFAEAILHTLESSSGQGPRSSPVLNYTLRQPVGVAGLISPWNLPLYLLSWKVAPALAAGNTVVAKPSEFTSLTAHLLAKVFVDAGVPKGVLNIVYGRGFPVGSRLVEHPKVPLISFTGGTVTGEKVAVGAAKLFKKVSLELGGKNPNIIFDDADLAKAVATTVRSSFLNQGEICLCGSRIYVQQGVFQQFVAAFLEETKKLRVGDPLEPSTTTGALVSKEHLAKVQSYVDLAREEGGTVLTGGGRPQNLPPRCADGYFIEPTIITGLAPDARCNMEEIFGPVVTITPFHTDAQVIEYANSVQYGLSASVWTQSLSRAHSLAEKIEAGTVWVNCWLQRDLRMPFGGVKQSGVGREGGEYSLEFFTQHKCVSIAFYPPAKL